MGNNASCEPACNVPMVIDGDCDLNVLLTCPKGVVALPEGSEVSVSCGFLEDGIAIAAAAAGNGGRARLLQTLFDDDVTTNGTGNKRSKEKGRKLQGKKSSGSAGGKSSGSSPSVIDLQAYTAFLQIGDCATVGLSDPIGETSVTCPTADGVFTLTIQPNSGDGDVRRQLFKSITNDLQGVGGNPGDRTTNDQQRRRRRKLKGSSPSEIDTCTSEEERTIIPIGTTRPVIIAPAAVEP